MIAKNSFSAIKNGEREIGNCVSRWNNKIVWCPNAHSSCVETQGGREGACNRELFRAIQFCGGKEVRNFAKFKFEFQKIEACVSEKSASQKGELITPCPDMAENPRQPSQGKRYVQKRPKFFRAVVLYVGGKPVATGSVMIS